MDIHHLRVFVSVFRNKSFSKAAEELSLTQPTVSDHIRALEAELECRLFDRLSRSIIPTREAVQLIVRAQEIIDKIESFKDILGEFRKDLSGHIIVGASTIPGTYILPALTASFRKKHPSVLFEITVSDSEEIINKIADNEFLIGMVGSRMESKHVYFEPFLDDELIIIAAGSMDVKKSIAIRDLAAYPVIMRKHGSGTRREFERIMERRGLDLRQLNVAGIFDSTDAIKQAVKEGMGISVISRRSVKDELRCGMLKEIKIRNVDMKRQFYIIRHKKMTLPPLYRSFLDFLKTQR